MDVYKEHVSLFLFDLLEETVMGVHLPHVTTCTKLSAWFTLIL